MKKITVILSAAVLLIAASTCIISRNVGTNMPSPGKVKEILSDSVIETESRDTYIIKKYGEKIGVFREGAGKPFRIIDTFVFTLPQNDVTMLSHGFAVYEHELVGIVEDYTG